MAAAPAPSWRLARSWGGPGNASAQFQGIAGIAVDRTGRVFVLDPGRESVRVFTTRGAYVTAWGNPGEWEGEFGGIAGIAIGKGDVLHVSEADNQRVQSLKADGTPPRSGVRRAAGSGDFDLPGAIALESDGDVLLADTLNLAIQQYRPGGEYLGSFGAPGGGDGQFTRSPASRSPATARCSRPTAAATACCASAPRALARHDRLGGVRRRAVPVAGGARGRARREHLRGRRRQRAGAAARCRRRAAGRAGGAAWAPRGTCRWMRRATST